MIYDLRVGSLFLSLFIFFPYIPCFALARNLGHLLYAEEHHAIHSAAFIEAAWQAVLGGDLSVMGHNGYCLIVILPCNDILNLVFKPIVWIEKESCNAIPGITLYQYIIFSDIKNLKTTHTFANVISLRQCVLWQCVIQPQLIFKSLLFHNYLCCVDPPNAHSTLLHSLASPR